jgi:hypothetical protein
MECCRKCYGWFQVTDGLYLGYGYDLDTTNLANYNAGSHGLFYYEIFKIITKLQLQDSSK